MYRPHKVGTTRRFVGPMSATAASSPAKYSVDFIIAIVGYGFRKKGQIRLPSQALAFAGYATGAVSM
jgi:hypothetical protein